MVLIASPSHALRAWCQRIQALGDIDELNSSIGVLLAEKMPGKLRDALLRAGAVRTRAILLTAGGAMLAAVPITLDPIFSGLAWSLIFGLLVSTLSRNQQQAMLTAVFFMIPMILLSGFVFPIKNMPELFQQVTVLIPLRYFLVIIRGIFLKGVGLKILWPQMAALAGMGLLTLILSSRRFRKTLA